MLKHLKTLQHVSIIIQIILMCVRGHAHTSNVMLPHHHSQTFTIFKNF